MDEELPLDLLDAAALQEGFEAVVPDDDPEDAVDGLTIEEGFNLAAGSNLAPKRCRRDGRRVRVRAGLPWQRSWAGLKFLRQVRKTRLAEQILARQGKNYGRLAGAWNEQVGLRHGDRVDATGAVPRKKRKGGRPGTEGKGEPVHPNTWTLSGTLHVAFAGIGKRVRMFGREAGNVGEVTGGRQLLATTTVASVFMHGLRAAISEWVQQLRVAPGRSCLFIGSHYDSTPIKLSFSALQEQLMDVARYLHLDRETGKWKALPYEKYRGMVSRNAPRNGVLEVFAQIMTVSAWRSASETDTRDVLVPPRVVGNNQASTVYRAVNTGVPEFSVEAINQLCGHLKYVLVSECPDNHSGNRRKVYATAQRLTAPNALVVPAACAVHQCNRIVDSLDTDLLGDVYAAKFVVHLSSYYSHLYRTLRQLVADELVIIPIANTTAAERRTWRAHSQSVLDNTVMRKTLFTRGRLDETGDSIGPAAREARAREQVDGLLAVCNGDIRQQKCVHIESGCCNDPAETKEKVFLALASCYLILGQSGLPSRSKWGTMNTACAQIAAGVMVHGVLPRAFRRAFPTWESGARLDKEGEKEKEKEAFQRTVQRKVYRVGKFLGDPTSTRSVMLLAYLTEHLDWAWQRVEHLDEQGKALLEVVHPQRSPFAVAARRLGRILQDPLSETALASVTSHYSHDDTEIDVQSLVTDVRTMVLKIVAQLHWRFLWVYQSWPYRLLTLVDMSVGAEERLQLAREFCNANSCCLDQHCSRKLRALVADPEELLRDDDLQGALISWAHKGRVCNMHVERMFARIRSSVPRHTSAERLAASGFLTQVKQQHAKIGGEPAGVTRHKLVEQEVPIVAFKEKARSIPTRARGHVLHMTQSLRVAAAERGRALTQKETHAVRRAACEEFRRMTDAERAALKERALNQAGAASHSCDPESDIDDGRVFDKEKLWGLASRKEPLDPDVAASIITRVTGSDKVGGITSYSGTFRAAFRDQMCVRSNNDIPTKEKVMYSVNCPVQHPGVCRTADRGRYKAVSAINTRILHVVLTQQAAAVGDCIVFTAAGPDGTSVEHSAFLAYARKSYPLAAVFVMASLENGVVRFESHGGELQVLSSMSVASRIQGHKVSKLTMRVLQLRAIDPTTPSCCTAAVMGPTP